MSKRWLTTLVLVAVVGVVCAAMTVQAQTLEDSLVVYAKAGRINQVGGTAVHQHAKSETVRVLNAGDELADGELVATGPNSRLEVLLSPGVYFRLAENSEFQMVSTNLDDVRLFLRRGSAMIHAGNGPDDHFLIQAGMPSGTAMIEKHGLYRLNVAGKRSELLVHAGESAILPADIKVKEGRRVAVTGGVAESVAKIDRDATPDALDSWTTERTEALEKANKALNQIELSRAVGNLQAATVRRGGYWVYVRQYGYSVFVPYGQGNQGISAADKSDPSWSGTGNRPTPHGTGEGPAGTVVPTGGRGRNPSAVNQVPGPP